MISMALIVTACFRFPGSAVSLFVAVEVVGGR